MITIIFGSNGFLGRNLDKRDGFLYPSFSDCNLLCLESIVKYFSQFNKDEEFKIVNMAAQVAGIKYNEKNNLEMLYKNSIINLNLLYYLNSNQVKCRYYLYFSSVCAYDGDSLLNIEDNLFNGIPLLSNFGYGWAKRFGAASTLTLSIDKPQIKTCILIPTNMYGPHDNFDFEMGHVIPVAIRKMLENHSNIEVYGNCRSSRDFIYVKDVAKILSIFIDKEINGIYNVSSGKQIIIYDLFNIIKSLTRYKGVLHFTELGKISTRAIDNKNLLSVLGKFDFTSLDEGLQETISYASQNIWELVNPNSFYFSESNVNNINVEAIIEQLK